MPEGDSVRRAADRMAAALVGRRVIASEFRLPQLATESVDGAVVTSFVPRGKHMLAGLVWDDGRPGVTLHTHFEMDGAWSVLGPGRRLPTR